MYFYSRHFYAEKLEQLMRVHVSSTRYILVLMIGWIVLVVAGCDATAAEQFSSPLRFVSPLEDQRISQQPYTLDVPEPAAGTGAVRGRLIAASPSAQMFVAGQVYLAPLNYIEGEVRIPYFSVDLAADPLEDLRNDSGEFAIFDVEPGEYGIVVYTPLTSYAVPGEEEGMRIIEVVEGEILDLGDIVIQ
jgi:hypothetical protein